MDEFEIKVGKDDREVKCFRITCECSSTIDYYVYACTKEEAKQLVLNDEYNDADVINETIDNIGSICEVND